ncbi:helix-turn-helix domain-containing protein [Vibrio rotiferianus]|uniref:helix-turn-helix domain-containing protein n=1 Tax=Vibrio rotiferianus TaxID=190895 RepID=UPI0011106EF2|nr:helix-turn-helix transcriptional regulator [Vibrio rotiferianus]TMX60648.1 XRE family transcriptional regulator [Vibrio rotiferianus]
MQFINPIPIRLKDARKKVRLSQKALGISIGMEESSASPRMNQYEKGVHTPDVSTLKLLADKLGVPLNFFFCEDDSSAELACLIGKMSELEKKELIAMLNSPKDENAKI